MVKGHLQLSLGLSSFSLLIPRRVLSTASKERLVLGEHHIRFMARYEHVAWEPACNDNNSLHLAARWKIEEKAMFRWADIMLTAILKQTVFP